MKQRFSEGVAVDLTELEMDKAGYAGSGLALVQVNNDDCDAIKYLRNFTEMETGDSRDVANDVLKHVTKWLGEAKGQIWLAMMSATQACLMRRVSLLDEQSMATLARSCSDAILSDWGLLDEVEDDDDDDDFYDFREDGGGDGLYATLAMSMGLSSNDLAEIGGFSDRFARDLLAGRRPFPRDVQEALELMDDDIDVIVEMLTAFGTDHGSIPMPRTKEQLREAFPMIPGRGAAEGGFLGPFRVACMNARLDLSQNGNPVDIDFVEDEQAAKRRKGMH